MSVLFLPITLLAARHCSEVSKAVEEGQVGKFGVANFYATCVDIFGCFSIQLDILDITFD